MLHLLTTMYIYIIVSRVLMPSMRGVTVIKVGADGVTGNGVRLNEMDRRRPHCEHNARGRW